MAKDTLCTQCNKIRTGKYFRDSVCTMCYAKNRSEARKLINSQDSIRRHNAEIAVKSRAKSTVYSKPDTLCPRCGEMMVGRWFSGGVCVSCAKAKNIHERLSKIEQQRKNRKIEEERAERRKERETRHVILMKDIPEEERSRTYLKDGRTISEARREAAIRRALPRCKKCRIVFGAICPRCKRTHGVHADEDPRYCVECYKKMHALQA